ncbi:MAG: PorT family protein [Flavobacteriales bacterium]|nr:PorT family protein [Flavobacteriales bacterium]
MKFLSICFILVSFAGWSQREKPMNYRRFDEKTFHFGFMLGANSADFTLYQVPKAYEQFGVKSVSNISQPGGQVGPVVTMSLGTPIVRMRFIPTLSFQERIIRYQFEDDSYVGSEFNDERVQSTNLDFPLMLQFRTLRVNNFAAYALGGFQYSLDLQSQEDASQTFFDPFIKIKRSDWQGQVGAGVEFFATYFKFGMELKYSHGIGNVFIQDGTTVSKPIDKLYNRVWWFSLIFEG